MVERQTGPVSFSGFILDYLSPINKRSFVAGKDRRYNLNIPIANAGNYEAPNSTVTIPFVWKIAKGAKLQYDGNALNPVNWPWFMALGFTYWDNTIPQVLDTPINLQYISTLEYMIYNRIYP